MIRKLIAAIWLGSGVFLILAANAAFRAAGNATSAADVVGAMLVRWHYIALAAPLILFVLALRRARAFVLALLFIAIVLAATQSFVDLRIRAIRAASPVSISSLERGDPIRVRFGRLHGISSLLLLMQTLVAAIVVARKEGDLVTFQVIQKRDDASMYMVRPADRDVPQTWQPAGVSGTAEDCLSWIEEKMLEIHRVDPPRPFQPIRNEAGEFAMWPAGVDVPGGWQAEGAHRSRRELLCWIEEIRTDMRPTRPGGP